MFGTHREGYWKGKVRSETTKKKISETRKRLKISNGEKNPNYIDGRSIRPKYCIDCGKKISYSAKKCIPCANKGEKGARYKDGRTLRKNYCVDCGKKIGYQSERCYSCANTGYHHPNWQGGKSNLPYPFEFNIQLRNEIRERDNYTCQKCGMTEENHLKLFQEKLHIHHIDYDKMNSKKNNLIALCIQCNSEVNFNRNYWKQYFEEKLCVLVT